jgi:hypothetical protein
MNGKSNLLATIARMIRPCMGLLHEARRPDTRSTQGIETPEAFFQHLNLTLVDDSLPAW